MVSQRKKKFNSAPSFGKIVVTDFWGEKGFTLVNFLPRVTTVKSDVEKYECSPSLSLSHKVLLLHDSASPHRNMRITEAITKFTLQS
jgi:hypothetical protein